MVIFVYLHILKTFWNQVRNDSAHRVQFFKKKLCKWLRTSEKRLLGPFWKEKNFATTFELVIGVCSVHFSNSLPTIFPTKNSFRKCFKCSLCQSFTLSIKVYRQFHFTWVLNFTVYFCDGLAWFLFTCQGLMFDNENLNFLIKFLHLNFILKSNPNTFLQMAGFSPMWMTRHIVNTYTCSVCSAIHCICSIYYSIQKREDHHEWKMILQWSAIM